ncbi:MAG: SRPBCC family protein [Pseudonocardiaceae bacterium]
MNRNSDRTQRLVDGLGVFSLGLGTAQLVAPGLMNRLIGANDNAKSRAVQRWLGGAREFTLGTGIETRYKPAVWLWARVAGDVADLSMLNAVRSRPGRPRSMRRRTTIATAAVVGVTVADLVVALRTSRDGEHSAIAGRAGQGMSEIEAKAAITVNRPVPEVFAHWNDVENLPHFMAHLQSVTSLGEGRSRWRAAGPAGVEVEWDAEISDHRIDEYIAWRSVGGATVTNWGEVEFRPAPGGRGTEIRVRLAYHPPAGKLGATFAKLFGEAPDQQLRDDLRRFKQVLETGEVVRSEGSPEGTKTRRLIAQRPAQPPTS